MKKNILLALWLLITPIVAIAEQCGVVSTNILSLDNNEQRVVLANVGQKARRVDGSVAITPGKHNFVVLVVRRGSALRNNANTFEYIGFEQLSDPIDFELEVQADKFYRLVAEVEDKAVSTRKTRYKIKVRNEIPKPCERENVLVRTMDVTNIAQEPLPQNLDYRLSLLMKDIRTFYRQQGKNTGAIHLVGEGGVVDKLGIVIDYQWPANKGLKVLAVTPTGVAATIGLKSGDVIEQINQLELSRSKMNHQQLVSSLKVMFNHLKVEQKANIKVKRGGSIYDLPVLYEQVSLPKYELILQIE